MKDDWPGRLPFNCPKPPGTVVPGDVFAGYDIADDILSKDTM